MGPPAYASMGHIILVLCTIKRIGRYYCTQEIETGNIYYNTRLILYTTITSCLVNFVVLFISAEWI